jgi:photosystem II stability/assembly factor-like uncharacterized protein
MRSVTILIVLFLAAVCAQTAKADWKKQASGTLAWLRDVYFLNEKTGWIAGSNGTLLATNDGGQNWKRAGNLSQDTIRRVYFTDANNGWLLCERDVYNLGANAASYLLRTTDNGSSWERIEFTGGKGREQIVGLVFSKNKSGFAVGGSGAFFVKQDDERVWKKMPFPVLNAIFDGSFSDTSNGTLVGAGGTILFTADAGATWNKANIYGNQNAKLNSIFFINPQNGWTVGAEGTIYQTSNAGRRWREQNSNVEEDLTDVFFNNTAEGWAVGNGGTILHTITAGNVWTKIDSSIKHRLEQVFFVGKKGWAVGFGGTILHYDESEINTKYSKPMPKLEKRN